MNIKLTVFLAATTAIALSACAPNPDKVKPSYTPQALYDNLSCKQIAKESIEVSKRAHEAVGKEHRHRRQDKAIVATGLVVFWPALFFTHGKNTQSASDLAQIKGEIQALQHASAKKNCGIVFKKG